MGNSEVGHLNLGAGAVVKQDLMRINDAIADGSFFENEALKGACERARNSPRGRLHLLGLVSDGGVHSGWEHLEATIELAADEGVPDVVFHAFTDGRDTGPTSGRGYVAELGAWLRHAGRIGTVSGRYYAMDRDRRWERIKLAYDAIVHAQGLTADSAEEAVRSSYERDETDEFIKPTVVGDYDGAAAGRCGHLHQLPPRPRAAADDGARRARLRQVPARRRTDSRPDDDDRIPQGLALPGRLPTPGAGGDAGRAAGGGGRQAAARGGDREVRARHLLLQRRPRGRVGGGGPRAGRLAARRRHLRSAARDERPRRRRQLLRDAGGRAVTASGSSTSPTPTWSATPG